MSEANEHHQLALELVKDAVIEAGSFVEREQMGEDSKLVENLGLDSLDATEAILYVEEATGIAIPDDQTEGVTTIRGAAELVTRLTSLSQLRTYHKERIAPTSKRQGYTEIGPAEVDRILAGMA